MLLKKRNLYILLFTSIIVMFFSLKDEAAQIVNHIFNAKPLWLLLGILALAAYLLLETLTIHIMIKEYNNTYKFKDTIKLILSTQFFNGITPFATGGQPFQVYILNKTGVSVPSATSACLQNFIVYQSVLVVFGFIALFLQKFFNVFSHSILGLKALTITGFTVNVILILGLFLVSYSSRFNKFISLNIINFLGKFKILKNTEKHRETLTKLITEFHKDAGILRRNPKILFSAIFFNILKLLSFYSISFFISKSIGLDQVTLFSACVATAYVMMITSIVPIPGATGGAEFSFIAFFSGFHQGTQAKSAMLLWRFVTYYIGLAVGFFVFAFGYKKNTQALSNDD